MNEPLSFTAWCYEYDIEAQWQKLHDELGDLACLLSQYKEYHYNEYLANFGLDSK